MPTPNPKRARLEIVVLVAVVAIVGAILGALGSSASPSTSKFASDAAPKLPEQAADQAETNAAIGAGKSASAAPAPAEATTAAPATEAPATTAPAQRRSATTAPPAPSIDVPSDEGLPVYAVPASIDATGGRDVTAELLDFIAAVPDGSVIRFPAGATFRAEGSLKIENRNNLVFDGQGAAVIADWTADRDRRHWWFRGGSNITIRDMAVRGANPNAGTGEAAWDVSREAQHGFDFGGVKGVLLERVRVSDVYGDFVYLGLGPGGWTERVVVRDSHFERNGRQGIAITGAQDVLITGNYIGQTRRATFDIEPNGPTWGARNIHIVDNDIGPGRLLFLAVAGSPHGPVADVLVEGNRLTGRGMNLKVAGNTDPAAPRTRTGFRIANNTSDRYWGNDGGALMNFIGVDGVQVTGNVQELQAGRGNAAVGSTSSCGVAVQDNDFPNAAEVLRHDGSNCP